MAGTSAVKFQSDQSIKSRYKFEVQKNEILQWDVLSDIETGPRFFKNTTDSALKGWIKILNYNSADVIACTDNVGVYSTYTASSSNSPVISEFLIQMTSNAKSVFIWWRHHEKLLSQMNPTSQTSIMKEILGARFVLWIHSCKRGSFIIRDKLN